jgi:uncharacterized membrane protein YgcG
LILLAQVVPTAQAQQRSVTWERFDTALTVKTDGSVDVAETQSIRFTGTYQQGFRVIPTDRVTRIDNVLVEELVGEGTVPYRASTSQAPNTYRTSTTDQGLRIDWWFPPTTNATRVFVLRYVAHGAIRIYDAGDQLQWVAVYPDRPGAVSSSTAIVTLPADVPASELQTSVYRVTDGPSTGAAPASGTGQQVNPRTVRFELGSLPAGTGAEIRVQFPHGLVSSAPPPWQQAADREDLIRQSVGPIGTFLALLLALVILAGGGVALFLMWYTSGRDPSRANVPATLDRPPSDLPAPLAGTLVDEVADVQDAVATLVDLADRGVVELKDEQLERPGGHAPDVRITLRGSTSDTRLRPYEQILLNALFGYEPAPQAEVLLSHVRGRFASTIPVLQDALHKAVADARLFVHDPQAVRQRYRRLGWLLVGVGLAVALVATITLGWAIGLAWAPGIALLLVGAMCIRLSSAMPRRTPAGAMEAARWRAFRKHLSTSADRADFLPYAVAFGLDRDFLRRLESIGTPPPNWYPPGSGSRWGMPGNVIVLPGGFGSPGGTWSGPSTHDTSSDGGGFGMPEVGGPQGWSDGLADLLNAASEAMSHGGGSGGWSGGGFGGGGGSGGGSGGFN